MTDETQLNLLQQALGSQYRIERELGRGGMGVVFLARDQTLDRRVAVKVVHPELTANRGIASRFLAEARTIARLRHPNIVAVHAAGELDGHLYYVMDYLPGETLRQRLTRDGRLEPELTRRILSDIAAALDAASAAGVVHRDLKPENILLEGDPEAPRALLTDFGIARLTEASSGHTGPGAVMGTPAYMSPEQASGDEVDGRSDLYALGVVGYEMLAGAPPFQGQHRVVISKQILDRPADLTTIRPDVPPAVSATIMRALEKAPDDRWPTGHALRASLWGDHSRRRAPLLGRPRLALAAALLAAAALLITALVKRPEPGGPPQGLDPRQSLLVLPFDNLRQDASLNWLRDGSVNMLTLALSQWRDLSVVDQHRVHDLLEGDRHGDGEAIGLEQARRLARAGGAWTVVLGDFSRTNDSLYLVARTYDVASGRRLEVISVEARESEDVRQLFDRLAARLLDLSGAPSEGRSSLTSVTTESLEAYRAYLQGVDDLHHWRLTDASQALAHAVEIDSTFSLAHFRLAVARGWMSPFDTLGVQAIRRAALTSERLPDRERGLIQAYLAFIEGDYPGSLSVYERLVARDPADIEAWYGLADASFHGGYAGRDVQTLSRSLHSFRRVVELDSAYALAYEHLGQLLTDAASASGWFTLVGSDSLAQPRPSDSTAASPARIHAVAEAVTTAEGWIRAQPATPRAHYHLYKALLAGRRANEARQVVAQLRTMYPDSVQPVFGFFDARAQLVSGDVQGAAQTVRQAIAHAPADAFVTLDYAPEARSEVMTGVNALAYYGDLDGATELIRLSREINMLLPEAVDSSERATVAEAWELGRLAELFSGTGAAPSRLRAVWNRGAELARSARAERKASMARSVASAAVGVFMAPGADTTLLHELRQITGRPLPQPIEGLVALRRGDSATARSLLDSAAVPTATSKEAAYGWGDLRPLQAEALFELGEYAKVVEVLRDFDPNRFGTRGFDVRWAALPRVRLLRGAAWEQLGQRQLAATEYRAVVEQWGTADAELLGTVQAARAGLARLEGARG